MKIVVGIAALVVFGAVVYFLSRKSSASSGTGVGGGKSGPSNAGQK